MPSGLGATEELFKAIFILGLIPIILYGMVSIFSVDVGLTHMLSYRSSSSVTFDPGLLVSGVIVLSQVWGSNKGLYVKEIGWLA